MYSDRLVLILLFFLTSCAPTSQNFKSTDFIWFNTTLNEVAFAKSSMHIPVVFDGDTTTYYFQFDTGSNKSFLYTGSKSDPKIIDQIKTKTSLSTSIGDLVLLARTSNSTYIKEGKTCIGTIGADILADQIIEIDFVNQTLAVLHDYNEAEYDLYEMELSYGRPVWSINIEGEAYSFLYDTGSSLFDLWTTKNLWTKWKSETTSVDEFPIRSWGKINTAYRSSFDAPNEGDEVLNQMKYIWYNSNDSFEKTFKKAGVDGIIGNRPFLNDVLLLDFSGRRIGVKKS